jgi:phosphoribosylformimino-5-aminoimidazole carboxamide ribotide isomerase
MRIIPVIDILGGLVVHAKYGQREKYEPIRSLLCNTSNPIDIALALKSNFGFNEFYIADLDSIIGHGYNLEAIDKISKLNDTKLMVDSGINEIKKAREILQAGVEKVIVGTETLTSFKALKNILKFAGNEHIIVSIDLKNGQILSKSPEIAGSSSEGLAKRLELMGIKELIVLDLSRVGSKSGVSTNLIKRVLSSVDIPVITGGGVRNIDDVLLLRDLGVSGILISTALHDLKIKREDILKL